MELNEPIKKCFFSNNVKPIYLTFSSETEKKKIYCYPDTNLEIEGYIIENLFQDSRHFKYAKFQ